MQIDEKDLNFLLEIASIRAEQWENVAWGGEPDIRELYESSREEAHNMAKLIRELIERVENNMRVARSRDCLQNNS